MQEEVIELTKRGVALLNDPALNKGTAFTQEERDILQLNGLIPACISTIEQQIERSYLNFSQKRSPLGKYQSLIALLSRNEHLFFQFIQKYAVEILPFIYTPTVGEAAMEYSRIYFHQRGLYISYAHKDRLDTILESIEKENIEVIVVTDGERILGLGDQGIGGMTIPIGKLILYTLFGGIHPSKTLPIMLDVGTNNTSLLKDPLYLGNKHPRIEGELYDSFIETFVQAVKKRFPKVLLQWEDFGKQNARKLLNRYQDQILSFNDDIQGTASVALAALLSAVRVKGESLSEQKIVIFGAGSAGMGIAEMIVKALLEEGMKEEEAFQKIYLVDKDGLIHFSTKNVTEEQKTFVQSQASLKDWNISDHVSLLDVVIHAAPSVLIGVSAQAGAFSKEVIEEMGRAHYRPIVLPLSNPTSKAECTPEEILQWTEKRAIIATGSPFPPVQMDKETYFITQCNNVYIFPAIGLGSLAVGASKITDGMFLAAARTLSAFSPGIKDPKEPLFPKIHEIRPIIREVAKAVGKKAIEEGVANIEMKDLDQGIDIHLWEPQYPRYAIRKKYD